MRTGVVVGIVALPLLTGCTSVARVSTPLVDQRIVAQAEESFPQIDSSAFGEPIHFDESSIFSLSEEQQYHFLRYFNSGVNANDSDHTRVYKYLRDIGKSFTYAAQTNDAQTTLGTTAGNCMSLAVLTAALAHLAEVEIKYQLVNRLPIYQEYGSVIFNAQHIRSVLLETVNPDIPRANFWRGKAVIDYYPSPYTYSSGYVNEDKFIAMYYQNLAAEALGAGEHRLSYWLLQKSLEKDPESAASINTLAVLAARTGDTSGAERLYQYGINNAENKISLLRNYYILLKRQGRIQEAARVERELDGMEDPNPFDWLHAANEAFDDGDHDTALRLYRKTVELASYLHQGYLGIAKIQYARGNYENAERALKKARAEAYEDRAQSLYDRKLAALRNQR